MRAVTIRDLRLRWPATERALREERELLVTRDGQPVAKLVQITPKLSKRKTWNLEKHKAWLNRFWKGKEVRLTERYLETERAERG